MKIPYPFIKLAPKLAAKLEENFRIIENAINTIDPSGSGQIDLPTATKSVLGVSKPDGSSLDISNGTVSIMQQPYKTAIVDYTKQGNPTITDNVVTNFTDSNYLTASNPYKENMASFKIKTKVKINSTPNNWNQIIRINPDASTVTVSLGFSILSSGRLEASTYYVGEDGGLMSVMFNYTDFGTISAGTTALVEYSYDANTGYEFKYSTNNGSSWTSVTSDVKYPPKMDVPCELVIGRGRGTGQAFGDNTIDLNETEIWVNGALAWTPFKLVGVAKPSSDKFGLVKADEYSITCDNGVLSVPKSYIESIANASGGSGGGVTIETTSNGYTIKRYPNNWAEIYISVPASDIFKLATEAGSYINTEVYATPEIYFGDGIEFADTNYFVYPCYGWTYVAGTDNYKYDNLISAGTVSKNYYPLYRTTYSCQIRTFQVSGLSFTGAAQFICSGYLAS